MDIQLTEPGREQSRARYPDSSGYIKRDGVRLYYEVYGSGGPTVFLLPTWSIIHSRHWKMQIPYLARHCRVLTFDGRGNGRSDRPAAGYQEAEFAADALAVMDATATEHAVIVSLSVGRAARPHPGGRAPGPGHRRPSSSARPCRSPRRWQDGARYLLDEVLPTDEGWPKDKFSGWLRDYRGFLEFFFSQMFTEPHSTKPIEDCIGWGLETTAETLIATEIGNGLDEAAARELCRPGSLPGAGDPGHGRRDHRARPRDRARRGDRRRPGAARGLGPWPARTRPGQGQPAAARLRRSPRGPPPALGARQGAPQARAVHLLADRPWPRPAGRGDRQRAAQAAP